MKKEANEKWGGLKETRVKDSVAKNVDMLCSKVIRGWILVEEEDKVRKMNLKSNYDSSNTLEKSC
jgi:hypothetical protein